MRNRLGDMPQHHIDLAYSDIEVLLSLAERSKSDEKFRIRTACSYSCCC